MNKRLLLVHAHPDDETITTGGTIARYVGEGVEVTVLTCTLGEEGEVIGDRWAGLVAGQADQLGGYRIAELTAALSHLGVTESLFLLGAGHFRDSGMIGTPSASNPRAFVNADVEEATRGVVAVIRDVRPHVVISYDTNGGYGHPDHIQANAITTAAVEKAGTSVFPESGEPWSPQKFYWTVTERSSAERAIASISEFPAQWRLPEPGELPSVSDADVTTALDVRAVLAAKARALAAHATQVSVAPSGTEFALSNNVVQPILPVEHFVLVRGAVGEVGEDGRESDLFSGTHD